jgi:hypothetical protein
MDMSIAPEWFTPPKCGYSKGTWTTAVIFFKEDLDIANKKDIRPRLRLIRGGQDCEMFVNSVRIVIAPIKRPPFHVDAIVAEEDTFLVMSESQAVIEERNENTLRIMTKAIEACPASPGSVLVKRGNPVRLLAIVHDFDLYPSWREEWISKALYEIFLESDKRRLHSLALPLIGTVHGSLKEDRFLYLLYCALKEVSPDDLKKLWLIVPEGSCCDIFSKLEFIARGQPVCSLQI